MRQGRDPRIFRARMSDVVKWTFSWVLALGLVLIHASPVAADRFVCLDDGARPDCCEESPAPESRSDGAAPLLDGSGCACCVTVRIVSRTTDATTLKNAVDGSLERGVARGTFPPPAVRTVPAGRHDPGDKQLPSIRTVVLLI